MHTVNLPDATTLFREHDFSFWGEQFRSFFFQLICELIKELLTEYYKHNIIVDSAAIEIYSI